MSDTVNIYTDAEACALVHTMLLSMVEATARINVAIQPPKWVRTSWTQN